MITPTDALVTVAPSRAGVPPSVAWASQAGPAVRIAP